MPGGAVADSTAPVADCAPAYNGSADDFASLVGQSVHGLTVVSGTTPDTFHGTVLGVLDQSIDLSTPLIMMQLGVDGISDGSTPTTADQTITDDGVWEGMSGSPVYTADGQLIGAVSTGLANGKSDIIGITPATAMLPYLPGHKAASSQTAASWAHPNSAMRHQLAQVTGISPVRAAQGLRPLSDLTERGLGAAALRHAQSAAKVKGVHKAMSTGQIAGMTAAAKAPVDSMIAGSNVADMVVWGDYAEGGIGTVTTVCTNHGVTGLVAFGHPLNGTGAANDVLMSASAVYVQPDPLGVAFKAANLGVPAGTISKDYDSAIGGTFGATPAGTTTFSHTASYDGGKPRTSVSYSADPNYWIDAAYYAADANDYTQMKAWMKGGAVVSFKIAGTDRNGKPFTLRHTDRYVSPTSIADDSLVDMGNFVYALSSMPGVHLTSVTSNSKLDDVSTGVRLAGVEQFVGGVWRKVDASRPAFAWPGRTLTLRAVTVDPLGKISHLPITVAVPASVKGGHGAIELVGGNSQDIPIWNVNSVATAEQALTGIPRNDQVSVRSTFMKDKVHVSHVKNTRIGTRVVSGSQVVAVQVY